MLHRSLLITAGVLLALMFQAPRAAAQAAHPADIRSGSCANPGEVVVTLTPLVVPEGEAQGPEGATPVAESATEIALMVPDLLSATHSLLVQDSTGDGTALLCGEIGGVVAEDGSLSIGLQAVNGGKVSGAATFSPKRKGDGTMVTAMLIDERRGRQRTGGGGGDSAAEGSGSEDVASAGEDGNRAADGEGNVEVGNNNPAPVSGVEDIARLNPNLAAIGAPGVDSQPGGNRIVDRPGWRDDGGGRRGKGGKGKR